MQGGPVSFGKRSKEQEKQRNKRKTAEEGFIVPLLREPYTNIYKSALERRDRKREGEEKERKCN